MPWSPLRTLRTLWLGHLLWVHHVNLRWRAAGTGRSNPKQFVWFPYHGVPKTNPTSQSYGPYVYIYILVHHILEAAQRALRDASRRRKLAATVVSNPADKRSRAPATSSTKVTPDGKKQCSSSVVADNLQPRCLSFSDDVTAGQVDDTILFFHFEIRSI